MPINPEFFNFSILNPVEYSEFESDLSEHGLTVAQHLFNERWDNSSIVDLSNIFTSKPILTDISSILTPIISDDLQLEIANKNIDIKERANNWGAKNLSQTIPHSLLLNNSDPSVLAEQLGVAIPQPASEIVNQIQNKLESQGLNVSRETISDAITKRYVRDLFSLEKIKGEYGTIGRFSSAVGGFVWDAITDPLNIIADIVALESGGFVGGMFAKGVAGSIASILGSATGLASKQVAINHLIVNSRREDLGLEKVSLSEAFGLDVLFNSTLGLGLPLLSIGGKIAFTTAQKMFSKPLQQRVVELIQTAKMRYRSAPLKTDKDLLSDLENVSSNPTQEVSRETWKAQKDGYKSDFINQNNISTYDESTDFELSTDFPRISDPSVKDLNRAFGNSLGSVFAGTDFLKKIDGVFTEKLVKFVSKMSESDLFVFSEVLAKSKTDPKLLPELENLLKFSDQKDFLKGIRNLIFDENTNSVKSYFEKKSGSVFSDAEEFRSKLGFNALKNNMQIIIEGSRSEHPPILSQETFLTDSNLGLSKDNPFIPFLSSETGLANASKWERLKKRTSSFIGDTDSFTLSDYLMGKIEELNTFSAQRNALKSEYLNGFAKLINGISAKELLSAWIPIAEDFSAKPSQRAIGVKNILNKLKDLRRETFKEYGVEYGEIADHLPQAWLPEAIRSIGEEKFIADFLPALDTIKTKKAYYQSTEEKLRVEKKNLENLIKDFDLKTKQRSAKFIERLKNAEKTSAYAQKIVDSSFLKFSKTITNLKNYIENGLNKNSKKITDEKKNILEAFKNEINTSLNFLKNTSSIFKNYKQAVLDEQLLLKSIPALQVATQELKTLNIEELLDKGFSLKILEKDPFGSLRTQKNALKYLESHNIIKRENSKAPLTEDEISIIGKAFESLPKKLQETRIKKFQYLKELNRAREEIFVLKKIQSSTSSIPDLQNSIDSIRNKFKKIEEDQFKTYLQKSEKIESYVSKIIEKTQLSLDNIKKRNITSPIISKFKFIEDLENELQKPFNEDQMRQIFYNISNEDLLSPASATVNPVARGSQRRIMYFKNPDAFEVLNRVYGKSPDIRTLIIRDIDQQIRDIASLRAFNGSSEFFQKQFDDEFKFLLGDRAEGFHESQLKRFVQANIDYVSGKILQKKDTLAKAFGNVYLSLIRNSALGGAGLTALFDDSHSVAFSGSENGFGFFRTLAHYIKGLTQSKITSEEASRLLVVLDESVAGFEDEMFRYRETRQTQSLNEMAKKIDNFTFKINGVNWLTDRGRLSFNKLFLQELGAVGRSNNKKFVEVLEKYGFNGSDFSEIMDLALSEDGIAIFSEDFKKTSTYAKILRALYSENRKAIASTSQSMRAVLASDGAGGIALGVVNSLFFLKRIPMQIWFDRVLLPIFRGNYGVPAKFFAQNLIFTTLRLTLKYMAMGYAPNFSDMNFYREIMLQNSAMIPFIQPFLSGDKIDRFNIENALGRSFLGAYGPLIDTAKLFSDAIKYPWSDKNNKQNRLAKDIHRVIRDFAPIKSHPALGLLYERFLFDQILLAMDPQAHRTLAAAEKYRLDSGKIKIF